MKNKTFTDFPEMTPEELWNYNMFEYDSQNIISKWLYKNFYNKIKLTITNILAPGDNVLEIGCGPAESSKRIFQFVKNASFEASEFDQRYVSIINKKEYPFRVIQESVYELKRENKEFSIILLLEVLEHLEYPDKALDEIFRVSNNYVIISVPNEPIWCIMNLLRGKYIKNMGNTPGHINHYNSQSLKKLLSKFSTRIKILKPFPWLIAIVQVK